MGFTHIDVAVTQISGANGRFESRFLVDTGAVETMAPASELARVGIKPVGKKTYELADGTRHDYAYGFAMIELLGETTPGRVIFGPEGTEPILGVTVLESMGLVVDPVSQSLKRLPAISLK